MKIGFAGDWHGNVNAVRRALDAFAAWDITTVAQVGDFGFSGLKAGVGFHDYVQRVAFDHGQTLYVTPGNHEDYDYLDSFTPRDDGWCEVRPNLLFAPRGLRWEWDGRTFVSLGGAASVDRTWRLNAQRAAASMSTRKFWWPQEAITDEDVDKVINGGHADVMITHEAPIIPEIQMRIKNNPHGFEQIDIDYSNQIAAKLHRAAHSVMPTLLFHGHHHFPVNTIKHWASYDTGFFSTRDIRGTTRVVGLNLEDQPGALAVLDTEDMSVVVS